MNIYQMTCRTRVIEKSLLTCSKVTSFNRYDSYLSNDMTIVEIESAFASNFKFHKEHHDDDDSYRAHRRDVLISHQNGDLSQHPTYHSID